MRRFLLVVLLLPALLIAGDHWTRFQYGPFEVLSAAGKKPGRETLNAMVQLRAVLGLVLGKQEMQPVWPLRVVVFNSPRQARGYRLSSFRLSRDAWVCGLLKNTAFPMRQGARILLDSSTGRMPAGIENGLLGVLSTLRIDGTRITLGIPVAPSLRGLDWARLHLFTVSPRYSGRVRVLFSNLQEGAGWDAAYQNAFEETPAEINAEVDAYLAAGKFPTRLVSGAPVSVRGFHSRDFGPAYIQVALADLLEGKAARAAYRTILNQYPGNAAALEGIGLYGKAIQAGSKSARCWLQFGRRQKDPAKARAAFKKAAKLNPRWAEPYVQMASADTELTLRARDWKMAAALAPRNAAYWQALAETYEKLHDYTAAGRAWTGAENAAADESKRARFLKARLAVERQRTEYLAAQRKRAADQRRKEDEQARAEAMAAIHAAEKRAAAGAPPAPANRKVVPWWNDTRPKQTITGLLTKVECVSGVIRLVIESSGGGATRLLIRDPSQVVLMGGGKRSLACGPQHPPRRISVEYFPEPDKKLRSAGDVSLIQFP